MKKILKIQALIFLILMILSWISNGNPFLPIIILLVIVVAPIMLFSYNWGMETYILSLIIFLLTILLMIYGYKNIDLKRGIVSFLIGFWIYALSSLMFLGTHF